MSPKAFQHAREVAAIQTDVQPRKYYCEIVDDQPYFPLLFADPTNFDSIREVTARIFHLFPSSSKNNNHHTNPLQQQLVVSQIHGGNTNLLFCVSSIPTPRSSFISHHPPSHHHSTTSTTTTIPPPNSVLVRIFGAIGLIDRDIETSTYAALAKQGFALAYYGRFGNGRIEEWSDWKPLTKYDLSKTDISQYIAIQLARLHCQFTIPKHLWEYYYPNHNNNEEETTTTTTTIVIPTMWKQLQEWLFTVQQQQQQQQSANNPLLVFDVESHDVECIQSLQLDRLADEIQWLQTSVIPLSHAKIGFCHNDLLASNILSTVPLQLIDFEYCGINYFSYDIANHFNEFAGGTSPQEHSTPDYTLFPSLSLQRHFCRSYLLETLRYNNTTNHYSHSHPKSHHHPHYHPNMQNQQNHDTHNNNNNNNNGIPSNHNHHHNNNNHWNNTSSLLEHQVDILLEEVQAFLLANHLVWGLWGIVQALDAAANNNSNNNSNAKKKKRKKKNNTTESLIPITTTTTRTTKKKTLTTTTSTNNNNEEEEESTVPHNNNSCHDEDDHNDDDDDDDHNHYEKELDDKGSNEKQDEDDDDDEFDYLHYGSCRIRQYYILKAERLEKAGGPK